MLYIQFMYSELYALSVLSEVAGVVTQGGYAAWVPAFRVQYSLTGVNWTNVTGNFSGNSDPTTEAAHYFSPIVKARYVRFLPDAGDAMRAAVLPRPQPTPC